MQLTRYKGPVVIAGPTDPVLDPKSETVHGFKPIFISRSLYKNLTPSIIVLMAL